MNYKLKYKSGDISAELPKELIDEYISKKYLYGAVRFLGHLYDDSGDVCGIKASADLGHGYGFSNGFKEFELRFGEKYSFEHDYTSIDGPSDWVDGSFKVYLDLVKSED